MKNLLSYIIISGVVILAISCAEPENPSATNMSYGAWEVIEYYVDGIDAGGNSVIDRFHLERDGSFILEDENGVVNIGTWTADDSNLTLSGLDSTSTGFDFSIVYQSYTKMHLLQNNTNPAVGEIRYLLDKYSDGSYYDTNFDN